VAGTFGDWPGDLTEAVGPGLVRAYRRGRKRGREAQDDPSTERLHEWRKRVKDHWYHLRLIRDAWPETLAAQADEAHRLADLLGDDHDLAVLTAEIEDSTDPSGDRADLLAAIEGRRSELQADAFELGARIYAEKPKAFGRRVEALLGAWRGSAIAA
jgi:CHAD domain-containing protein